MRGLSKGLSKISQGGLIFKGPFDSLKFGHIQAEPRYLFLVSLSFSLFFLKHKCLSLCQSQTDAALVKGDKVRTEGGEVSANK